MTRIHRSFICCFLVLVLPWASLPAAPAKQSDALRKKSHFISESQPSGEELRQGFLWMLEQHRKKQLEEIASRPQEPVIAYPLWGAKKEKKESGYWDQYFETKFGKHNPDPRADKRFFTQRAGGFDVIYWRIASNARPVLDVVLPAVLADLVLEYIALPQKGQALQSQGQISKDTEQKLQKAIQDYKVANGNKQPALENLKKQVKLYALGAFSHDVFDEVFFTFLDAGYVDYLRDFVVVAGEEALRKNHPWVFSRIPQLLNRYHLEFFPLLDKLGRDPKRGFEARTMVDWLKKVFPEVMEFDVSKDHLVPIPQKQLAGHTQLPTIFESHQ